MSAGSATEVKTLKCGFSFFMSAGPLEGKDHRKPERYFEDVLAGARIVEGQCSKDVMFE